MKKNQEKILKILTEKNLLKEKQLAEIKGVLANHPDKNLREILVKGGFIDAEKLAEIEADESGFSYINLLKLTLTREVIMELPENLARTHQAICFEKNENKIKIALADLDDYNAREAIEFWATSRHIKVEFYVCSLLSFESNIRNYEAIQEELTEIVESSGGKDKGKKTEEVSTENIEQVIKSAPVAQIVSLIVKHATENRASDVHIEPFQKASRVRYRVDGILHTVLDLPLNLHDSVISRIKVLSNLKIDETRVPQDGRFRYTIGGKDFDVRVSIMPLSGNEKVTMRILDVSTKALTLQELGFSDDVREEIETALKKSFGMALVTGPTGSGKSTTLFALLSQLNKDGVNICTLEDPIEYYMPGVNQAQIRPEVKFTFASGLRALMRQDPDVIMVGEIRDGETAEMSVHAALTGHQVLSTLHTNDAFSTVPRLMDMKVEPFLLASTINLIIAQRLARRVCPKCKEPYELPKEMSDKVARELKTLPPEKLPKEIDLNKKLMGYRGKGCPACKETGYKGRVVISEVLPISEPMRIIIADGYKIDSARKAIATQKLVNMMQDGLIKALQGETSLEEVFRVTKEIEEQE